MREKTTISGPRGETRGGTTIGRAGGDRVAGATWVSEADSWQKVVFPGVTKSDIRDHYRWAWRRGLSAALKGRYVTVRRYDVNPRTGEVKDRRVQRHESAREEKYIEIRTLKDLEEQVRLRTLEIIPELGLKKHTVLVPMVKELGGVPHFIDFRESRKTMLDADGLADVARKFGVSEDFISESGGEPDKLLTRIETYRGKFVRDQGWGQKYFFDVDAGKNASALVLRRAVSEIVDLAGKLPGADADGIEIYTTGNRGYHVHVPLKGKLARDDFVGAFGKDEYGALRDQIGRTHGAFPEVFDVKPEPVLKDAVSWKILRKVAERDVVDPTVRKFSRSGAVKSGPRIGVSSSEFKIDTANMSNHGATRAPWSVHHKTMNVMRKVRVEDMGSEMDLFDVRRGDGGRGGDAISLPFVGGKAPRDVLTWEVQPTFVQRIGDREYPVPSQEFAGLVDDTVPADDVFLEKRDRERIDVRHRWRAEMLQYVRENGFIMTTGLMDDMSDEDVARMVELVHYVRAGARMEVSADFEGAVSRGEPLSLIHAGVATREQEDVWFPTYTKVDFLQYLESIGATVTSEFFSSVTDAAMADLASGIGMIMRGEV